MIFPWLSDKGLLCQKYLDRGTKIGIKCLLLEAFIAYSYVFMAWGRL